MQLFDETTTVIRGIVQCKNRSYSVQLLQLFGATIAEIRSDISGCLPKQLQSFAQTTAVV
jgi:hypothetical protein